MNKRLEPTSVRPPAHVNTGPIDLKILLVHVLETKKLMLARDVNSKPMSFVTIPRFLRNVEKNAWNVESPTLKQKDTRQTDATPAHKLRPNGQEINSSSSSSSGFAFARSMPSALSLGEPSFPLFLNTLLSCTSNAATSDASIDAAAVIEITNDKDPEESRTSTFVNSSETPIIFRRISNSNPPAAGPIINARVEDASFKLRYLGSFPSFAPISARYALLTGELPAKRPVSDLASRN
mmetsp:Transcript_12981/g.32768  ORF Transcript_12981/g.32768 Transcript_12981/m.32768 type:complete len:237 (-) Transcript_12981:880-1590(-)